MINGGGEGREKKNLKNKQQNTLHPRGREVRMAMGFSSATLSEKTVKYNLYKVLKEKLSI